jgi:hypothetical protein
VHESPLCKWAGKICVNNKKRDEELDEKNSVKLTSIKAICISLTHPRKGTLLLIFP